jgi:protein-S-isoprenylcysteine O-methyltransferase Ste14
LCRPGAGRSDASIGAKRSKTLAYAAFSWVPHAVVYVLVPLLVSRFGARHGWKEGRPSSLNLVGSPVLLGGAALIGWAILSHYRASPEGAQFRATPNYLVTEGAYGFTRNPLYLGGACMWAGWAILLGSLPIFIGGLCLFGFLAGVGIPFEERMLHDRFGDVYGAYRKRVPRWVGVRRSDSQRPGPQ